MVAGWNGNGWKLKLEFKSKLSVALIEIDVIVTEIHQQAVTNYNNLQKCSQSLSSAHHEYVENLVSCPRYIVVEML